jgi:hypothetical protein
LLTDAVALKWSYTEKNMTYVELDAKVYSSKFLITFVKI